jgi:hypothetical protein
MSNKNTTEIEDTNYIIILKQIKKIMVVLWNYKTAKKL